MDPWLAITVLSALGMFGALAAASYNRLVALNGHCDNAFAQIEVQLKRRYDLIPNLVECVRGYMAHERETLERVIAARNAAASVLQQAARRPGDADSLAAWMSAEGSLTGALSRLTVAMEGYPELKANASVANLTEEMTTTENRIAYARQAYNDWVTGFNFQRQTFPSCLLAGPFGFGRNRSHLEFAEGEKLTMAPRVVLT